jgi:phosphatidylglycerophosphatase A
MEKFNKFKWFIITGFFSGLLPKAPGTWGSLTSTILAYFIILYFPNPYTTIWLLIILFSIIGYKFINEYEQKGGIHDDKRIVIDEFAGVLISIGLLGNLKEDTLIKLFLAFISFRFFDIYKPSIIGKIDKKAPGALGVMGDDIVAGFFGGIMAGILYMIYLKIKGAL